MAKKIKLSDAAKDLNVSSQELIDLFAEKGDTKKKAATSLTEDEMNTILEHYTKLHEVKNFDEYFASKIPDLNARKSPSLRRSPRPKRKLKKQRSPKRLKKLKRQRLKRRRKSLPQSLKSPLQRLPSPSPRKRPRLPRLSPQRLLPRKRRLPRPSL